MSRLFINRLFAKSRRALLKDSTTFFLSIFKSRFIKRAATHTNNNYYKIAINFRALCVRKLCRTILFFFSLYVQLLPTSMEYISMLFFSTVSSLPLSLSCNHRNSSVILRSLSIYLQRHCLTMTETVFGKLEDTSGSCLLRGKGALLNTGAPSRPVATWGERPLRCFFERFAARV